MEWLPDGQKVLEMSLKDGRLHGVSMKWHANGRKASEGEFRDGKEHGLHLAWDEDGRPTTYMKTCYEMGTQMPVEVCELVCPPGADLKKNLSSHVAWCEKQGTKHGGWLKWSPGKDTWIESRGEYKEGKKHGRWVWRHRIPGRDTSVCYDMDNKVPCK